MLAASKAPATSDDDNDSQSAKLLNMNHSKFQSPKKPHSHTDNDSRILDKDVQDFLEVQRPMTAEGLSSVLGMLNHFGNHLEGDKHVTALLHKLGATTLRSSSKRRVKKSCSAQW